QAEDGIRDRNVTGVQTCALPICEMVMFARADDVFSDGFVRFAHSFTRATVAKYPDRILTGSSIETAVGDLIDVPGASYIAPSGRSEERRVGKEGREGWCEKAEMI